MTATEQSSKLAIKALEQMRGDDLARAERQFRGYTGKQLDEQYGQSGQTCQQILDGYRSHNAKINQAIEWVQHCASR